MSLIRLFTRYNLRSLLARGTDAVTTLAGIALTAAVLVVVLALGYGLDKAFATSGHEGVVLLMYKGSIAESQSILDTQVPRKIETFEGIALNKDGQKLVSPELVVLINTPRRGSHEPSNVTVRGVRPNAYELRRPGFKAVAGEEQPKPDAPSGVYECIVGKKLAERFENMGLGETFGAGRQRFKVVGLFECPGSEESEVWAHERDVRAAFQRQDMFSSVRVKIAGPEADALKALDEAIKKEGTLPLKAQLERAYYADQQEAASAPIKAVAWVLAVLMSIGASLGAMNTMYARVAARAREIGTLRALGFRKTTIVISFVLESISLAVAGGAIGCCAGFLVNGLATGTTNFMTFSEVAFAFDVTPQALLAAIELSAFVGLVGGLLPAFQAARMPIPLALREV